jgi:hypothetical protein
VGTTKNFEILVYEESPIGMICLRRRELLSEPGTVVTEITLDHMLLMSSCNSSSEEALSLSFANTHPRAHRVTGGEVELTETPPVADSSRSSAREDPLSPRRQANRELLRRVSPGVAALEATDPRKRHDSSSTAWTPFHRASVRRVLLKSEVAAISQVVLHVITKKLPEVGRVEDNDPVQELPLAAADPTLCNAILPRAAK